MLPGHNQSRRVRTTHPIGTQPRAQARHLHRPLAHILEFCDRSKLPKERPGGSGICGQRAAQLRAQLRLELGGELAAVVAQVPVVLRVRPEVLADLLKGLGLRLPLIELGDARQVAQLSCGLRVAG